MNFFSLPHLAQSYTQQPAAFLQIIYPGRHARNTSSTVTLGGAR